MADPIGLVLARPARTLGLEPFFMELIDGIEETLSADDRSLLLHVVPDHEAEITAYRRRGEGGPVDAVVLVDLVDDDTRLASLRELGSPGTADRRARDHRTATVTRCTGGNASTCGVTVGVIG